MYTCWIYSRKKYLDRQGELIQGDETAKLAYEEKKRGFHLVGKRKRIVNATRKTKTMAIGKKFRSLCVITRAKTIKLCRRD